MYIAVCDDSSFDRKIIIDMLNSYFLGKSIVYEITSYENGLDLIYDIQDGKGYDLVFLDIYMEEVLGIDVARKLRKINYTGDIVFMTATIDFAVDGYEVEAVGYLLKPHSYEKLYKVLDRVVKNYDTNVYRIRQRNNFVSVPYNEILYIESNNSKCILHSNDNNSYVIYKRLNEIENELNDSRFLRCHQSYLVNMNYIRKVDKHFVLSNGDMVCIRQRNIKAIKQEYIKYINSKII
ncbi:MAG: LytTR family DNA-binding domain-containing protein [Acutalibacteraceae bacterium]|nr:LytTR family DNA-binding domain-containing protein [Acutalibacteraceae bacterium]